MLDVLVVVINHPHSGFYALLTPYNNNYRVHLQLYQFLMVLILPFDSPDRSMQMSCNSPSLIT